MQLTTATTTLRVKGVKGRQADLVTRSLGRVRRLASALYDDRSQATVGLIKGVQKPEGQYGLGQA